MSAPRRDPDLVRPYVRTGGQVRPSRDVRLETVVWRARPATDGLGPDARRVLTLFGEEPGGLGVADIAAVLELPSSTVRILVSALLDDGFLTGHIAEPPGQVGVDLLQEVLNGLRAMV